MWQLPCGQWYASHTWPVDRSLTNWLDWLASRSPGATIFASSLLAFAWMLMASHSFAQPSPLPTECLRLTNPTGGKWRKRGKKEGRGRWIDLFLCPFSLPPSQPSVTQPCALELVTGKCPKQTDTQSHFWMVILLRIRLWIKFGLPDIVAKQTKLSKFELKMMVF